METGITARLLTERDAATYVGMSRQFLRKSRLDGAREDHTPGPPFIRLGRSIRYAIDDLDAWISEHRQQVCSGRE